MSVLSSAYWTLDPIRCNTISTQSPAKSRLSQEVRGVPCISHRIWTWGGALSSNPMRNARYPSWLSTYRGVKILDFTFTLHFLGFGVDGDAVMPPPSLEPVDASAAQQMEWVGLVASALKAQILGLVGLTVPGLEEVARREAAQRALGPLIDAIKNLPHTERMQTLSKEKKLLHKQCEAASKGQKRRLSMTAPAGPVEKELRGT